MPIRLRTACSVARTCPGREREEKARGRHELTCVTSPMLTVCSPASANPMRQVLRREADLCRADAKAAIADADRTSELCRR